MSGVAFQVYFPSASPAVNDAIQRNINQAVMSVIQNTMNIRHNMHKDLVQQALDSQ